MKCRAASSPILKAQARSMGLEERWHEVAHMYSEVNHMFGDIVKVTPSSKVVATWR
jgi:pyruvate carboxylase